MKERLILATVFLFLGFNAFLLCLPGCSGGPQRIAYNAQVGAQMTVDTAMKAWGDYVQQFHPGVEKERQVLKLYNEAKAAAIEAIDASELYAAAVSNGNTNSAPGLNDAAQAKQQAAAKTLSDLVNLLRQFGVKL